MDGTYVITGAVSFITGTLLDLLLRYKANIYVRVLVREKVDADLLLRLQRLKDHNARARCRISYVPDALVPGKLEEVLADADYVIHFGLQDYLCPTPVPRTGHDLVVGKAVARTLRLLEAAHASKNIKRIVNVSSIIGTMSFSTSIPSYVKPPMRKDGRIHMACGRDRGPEPVTTFPFACADQVIHACAVVALRASDRYMQDRKPEFDVVNLMVPHVVGEDLLAEKTTELNTAGNGVLIACMTGHCDPETPPELGLIANVVDVARYSVIALDKSKIKTIGGIESVNLAQGFEWPKILQLARALGSQADHAGIFTMKKCTKKTKKLYRNDYEAYQFFDREQICFEQTVEAVAVQYKSFWRKEWERHRLTGEGVPPQLAARKIQTAGPRVGLELAKRMQEVTEMYKSETKEARRRGEFEEAAAWAISWKTYSQNHDEFIARMLWELDHSQDPKDREAGREARIEERARLKEQARIEEIEQPSGRRDSDPELTEKERKRVEERPSPCRQNSDPQITEAEKARKAEYLVRWQNQDPYEEDTDLQKARRGKQPVRRQDPGPQMTALQWARKGKQPVRRQDPNQEREDGPS